MQDASTPRSSRSSPRSTRLWRRRYSRPDRPWTRWPRLLGQVARRRGRERRPRPAAVAGGRQRRAAAGRRRRRSPPDDARRAADQPDSTRPPARPRSAQIMQGLGVDQAHGDAAAAQPGLARGPGRPAAAGAQYATDAAGGRGRPSAPTTWPTCRRTAPRCRRRSRGQPAPVADLVVGVHRRSAGLPAVRLRDDRPVEPRAAPGRTSVEHEQLVQARAGGAADRRSDP